jgi:hypothetical protein
MAKRTKDKEKIRTWAEKRDGEPARVAGTESLLRIDFPRGNPEENLEKIRWEEFFEIFDNKDLTFLYEEKTDDGQMSRFNKFIEEDKSN